MGSLRGRKPPIPVPPLLFAKGKGTQGLGFYNPRGRQGGKSYHRKGGAGRYAQSGNHGITNIEMRNLIKLIGFVLIAVGAIGLLISEFVWGSSSRTIIFAVVSLVGFINLAFAHFDMKGN